MSKLSDIIIGLLIGCYLTGTVVTFLVVGFFCILGGRGSDFWMPFAYAMAWPLVFVVCVSKRIFRNVR